jgi:uncharacterized protein YprB with RNaseH-like and TPR domain
MLRNLDLDKPLAFIDIETTGLRPNSDRIVELSVLKIHPGRLLFMVSLLGAGQRERAKRRT